MKSLWVAFVARRWFSGRKGGKAGLRSGLAAAGIAAGVATLIVVLGVMNGLQGGYIDSILEVSSFHLRVTVAGEPAAAATRIAALPGIRSAVAFIETHVMATGPSGRDVVLTLRSLPADAPARDPGMFRALGMGTDTAIPADGGIILGKEAAALLGADKGARVLLSGAAIDPAEGFTLTRTAPVVSDIFVSGYYEFDSSLALALMGGGAGAPAAQGGIRDDAQGAAPGDGVVVGVKLSSRFADQEAVAAIRRELGDRVASIQSWRDYNRSFFGALRTEKTVMMLLVGLIFAVVGVNIHHAMRRAVAVRMPELAALRSFGASASGVRAIFMADGLGIGLGGALAGTIAGCLIVLNINGILAFLEGAANAAAALAASVTGGAATNAEVRIFSPTYFYIDRIPVRVSPLETAFIALLAAASALLAARSASGRVSAMDPAEVLRNE